jgi:hypothetical protein
LTPYSDHIGIGGVLGRLRGLQNDDSDAFEKAMDEIGATRVAIGKSETTQRTAPLLDRLAKAQEDLQTAYLECHSVSPAATAERRGYLAKSERSGLR